MHLRYFLKTSRILGGRLQGNNAAVSKDGVEIDHIGADTRTDEARHKIPDLRVVLPHGGVENVLQIILGDDLHGHVAGGTTGSDIDRVPKCR